MQGYRLNLLLNPFSQSVCQPLQTTLRFIAAMQDPIGKDYGAGKNPHY